jgi:hypothetical protein
MLGESFNSRALGRFDQNLLSGPCAVESGFVNHKSLRFRISCPKAFSHGRPERQADLSRSGADRGLACGFY